MNNLFGITNIHIKKIVLNPSEGDTKINDFLDEYDGNIIDIQYIGQSLGQITVFITYKYSE